MRASELIAKLQEVIAAHGDIKVFTGDMEYALIEVRETSECPEVWGDKYIFVCVP
jgi:hypothetical protein